MPKTETTNTAVKLVLPDLQIEYARYTSSISLTPEEAALLSQIDREKQAQADKKRTSIGFQLPKK